MWLFTHYTLDCLSLTALQKYSSSKALQFLQCLLRLFIAPCRLLCATEIMTNTLLCWVGPRWEIKHPCELKGLTKNNLVDLCALPGFPVHLHFLTSLLPLSLSSVEGVFLISTFQTEFCRTQPSWHVSLILLSKIEARIKSWHRNIQFILQI